MAWRGVVWCGVVWNGVEWCGMVWCGDVWCVYARFFCCCHSPSGICGPGGVWTAHSNDSNTQPAIWQTRNKMLLIARVKLTNRRSSALSRDPMSISIEAPSARLVSLVREMYCHSESQPTLNTGTRRLMQKKLSMICAWCMVCCVGSHATDGLHYTSGTDAYDDCFTRV